LYCSAFVGLADASVRAAETKNEGLFDKVVLAAHAGDSRESPEREWNRKTGIDRAFDTRSRHAYIQCRYMATTTQIAKWGNSLGLRLPKSVALEAQVDEGDTVDVSVKNGAIVIRPSRPAYSLGQLVSKITPRNRHDESDWGSPVGDESW
jgi:antitoxin MazE